MGKLDTMKILKETRARTTHICTNCNKVINPGEIYFSEKLKDRFLQSLHIKKFCSECYKKFGDNLLNMVSGSGKYITLEKFYKTKTL